MGGVSTNEEDLEEDYCFVCKDGGLLRVCDYKNCFKAYHAECIGKESDFLESEEYWECVWHFCCLCKKESTLKCFCCEKSVCSGCIKDADLVQVKENPSMGFCRHCLRLAILIETNVDIEPEMVKVDFEEEGSYELWFKEYWEIVKNRDGLSLVDLQAANAVPKNGTNFMNYIDDDLLDDSCSSYGNSENDLTTFSNLNDKKRKARASLKRGNLKKSTFNGWASSKLIEFLSSVGRDTEKQLTHQEVCDVVKEYIQVNKCLHSAKKKLVLCDRRLQLLFRKKKLKYYQISSLLEEHFTENDGSSTSILFFSEEENDSVCKKEYREDWDHKKDLERKKLSYASIVEKNVKLIYLKRSLVLNLLQNSENFDSKVVGCFVRVKNDDIYNFHNKKYYLGEVTGTKRSTTKYNVGEACIDVVLCLSNTWKDIQISLLSDDDFDQEECDDLQMQAKECIIKRRTVEEFEEKARSVHWDVVNHWIDQELVRVQKLIDQANEKGWRRELFEFIDKRKLLESAAERQRLLEELPKVIADAEKEDEISNDPVDGYVKG